MNIFINITRYLARTISVLVLLFVILSGFTDFPDPLKLSNSELFLLFPFLAVLISLVISWRKEILGGGLTIVFAMLFIIIANVANWFTYLIVFAGVLFLLTGIVSIIKAEEEKHKAISD